MKVNFRLGTTFCNSPIVIGINTYKCERKTGHLGWHECLLNSGQLKWKGDD